MVGTPLYKLNMGSRMSALCDGAGPMTVLGECVEYDCPISLDLPSHL